MMMMMRGRTQLARTVAFLAIAFVPVVAAAEPSVKLKWPGALVIGETECGTMTLTIAPGVDGPRTFMWHIDDCPQLEALVAAPVATPSPTPRPTNSPGGSVTPPPGDPELCPDGYLSEPASKTDPWYGLTVDVPEGTTKRFCAPVMAPLVKTYPNQITFSWYDVSDQDCGAINVKIDAVDLPLRPRGGQGYSASGQYVYYAKVGSRSTPEQTAPGIYVVTLTGGPSAQSCSRFRIAWRVS
jgi:hypothetical protein